MGEEEQKAKVRTSTRFDLNSRFWKTFLVVLAAFLTFAGPTYIVYVLSEALEIGYTLSMISGFALFLAGLVLMLYLVRKKVIT